MPSLLSAALLAIALPLSYAASLNDLYMADPPGTCQNFANCVSVSWEPKVIAGCGGSCGWKVCLRAAIGTAGCPKLSGALSHACFASTCSAAPTKVNDFDTELFCYEALPGPFRFAIKDAAATCNTDTAVELKWTPGPLPLPSPSPVASCKQLYNSPDKLDFGDCSGNGDTNLQSTCQYTVILPPASCGPCVNGDWVDSSECDKVCGGGSKTQTRDACPGAISTQIVSCNVQACPCENGPWVDASLCSKTCGSGSKTQTRNACPGAISTHIVSCNTQACDTPINPNEVPCSACAKMEIGCLKELDSSKVENPFLLSTDFGNCRNVDAIAAALTPYGCKRSELADCNTIYCTSYVPPEIINKLDNEEDLNVLDCDDAVWPGIL